MLSAWAVAVNTGFTKTQESLLQSAPAGAHPDDDHVGHKDGGKCASVGHDHARGGLDKRTVGERLREIP
jgi:hypothetical protein